MQLTSRISEGPCSIFCLLVCYPCGFVDATFLLPPAISVLWGVRWLTVPDPNEWAFPGRVGFFEQNAEPPNVEQPPQLPPYVPSPIRMSRDAVFENQYSLIPSASFRAFYILALGLDCAHASIMRTRWFLLTRLRCDRNVV